MNTDFYRVKRLPPYVFEGVNKMKAELRAAGRDVIDFGMGNPDLDTPQHIIEKLVESAQKPGVHRYSSSKGVAGLRKAQAAYYERRFGVAVDPDTEVIATLGSKEGLANLAAAISAPGDVILAPTTPSASFGLGEKDDDPLGMYLNDVFTVTVNLAGLPAIALPTGQDRKGLPLGLQLIGRPWEEADLLSSAYALEQAAGFVAKPDKWW